MTKKNTLFYMMLVGLLQLTWAQDVSLVEADLARYALRSESNTLSFLVKNNGVSEITSLQLNWNDGSDHIATVRTSIPAGEVATIAHPSPIRYNSIVEKAINVEISKVNGVSDLNATDNSSTVKINTLIKEAKKVVFVEKGTGTWCPQCPGGIAAMDYMTKNYHDTFAGVAIHSGDPMENKSYLNQTGIRAFPTGNIDRVEKKQNFIGVKNIEPFYKDRIKVKAPADLSMAVKADGAKIEIKTSATFYSDFRSAKFALSVILTEDGVKGTSSGYAQKNNFSGSSGDWGGFENLPNPVPASRMVYNHVGRAVIGGYNGTKGSVPSTISVGDVAEYTFNHTLPKSDAKNYNLILLLINTSNGSVANAKEVKLEEALSVGEVDATFASLKMYPNPAKEQLNIAFDAVNEKYTVVIYDMLGREVLQKEYNTVIGKQRIAVPVSKLKSGSYIASISSGKSSYSQAVIIE